MKIAVTYDNGEIFQHFGHSEKFKFYEVSDGKILNSEVVDTNGSGHGALTDFLFGNGVDILICGGIGGGAKDALSAAGIKIFGGVSGNADKAAADFLSGTLDFDPGVCCSHYHGEHKCGEHDCH